MRFLILHFAGDIQALLLQASVSATKDKKKQPHKKQQQQHVKASSKAASASCTGGLAHAPAVQCTPIEWGEEVEEGDASGADSSDDDEAAAGDEKAEEMLQRWSPLPLDFCPRVRNVSALLRYIAQHGQPLSKASSGSGGGDLGSGTAAADSEGVWQEEFEDDGDRHWAQFARALEADPEQALRYSWCGRALWPKPERPAPTPCPVCGAPRVFECQLMPPLLRVLNVDALSVAVFCCSDSCTPTATSDGFELAQEVFGADAASFLISLMLKSYAGCVCCRR